MKTTLIREIIERAKVAAAAFVEEFSCDLDPASTDWDATAWEEDQKGLRFEHDGDRHDAFLIYQAALVLETLILVSTESIHVD